MKRRAVLTIRRFCAQDADSVVAVLRSSPEAAPWSTEDLLRFSDNSSGQRATFLVCEYGGEVTAFLMARAVGDEAELLNIAVSPAHRCTGQATQLLKCAMDQFRGSAIRAIYLEVRESNMPARAFYEKHGFSVSGKRPNYYQRPDEPAISMMRKLTASLS